MIKLPISLGLSVSLYRQFFLYLIERMKEIAWYCYERVCKKLPCEIAIADKGNRLDSHSVSLPRVCINWHFALFIHWYRASCAFFCRRLSLCYVCFPFYLNWFYYVSSIVQIKRNRIDLFFLLVSFQHSYVNFSINLIQSLSDFVFCNRFIILYISPTWLCKLNWIKCEIT